MTSQTNTPPVAEMGFEAAYAELEATVARLEAPDLPLDEALRLYEHGLALSERCQTLLDEAQLKVRTLGRASPETLDPPEGEP